MMPDLIKTYKKYLDIFTLVKYAAKKNIAAKLNKYGQERAIVALELPQTGH